MTNQSNSWSRWTKIHLVWSRWVLGSTSSYSHSFIRTASLAFKILQQNVHLHASIRNLENDNLDYTEEIYGVSVNNNFVQC